MKREHCRMKKPMCPQCLNSVLLDNSHKMNGEFLISHKRKSHNILRQSLLDGLKANWSQLHRDYQGLSVVVDTESKKQRKKAMEAKLAQLEGDIQRVEKHPVIYVEQ